MAGTTPTGDELRIACTSLLFVTISACSSNPCLDMCQEYEVYLEECGYGWSTAFADEGWTTLDDCYDTYWEADDTQQETCDIVVIESKDKACF